ncbi:MAG: glutathione peroxidase [Deltaproteobacteria bacterium]|nr:glutathione peroxidase [Deltaproteobacteria bacterium]HCH61917.1 glutathione peroxidase [Deltaproteobacteria bacterium]|tara:strand:+ start:580 stop:1137 length:558 start_codon:yes stop_codon:yes gene_type:complete
MNRSVVLLAVALGCATTHPPEASAKETVVLSDLQLTRLDGTKLPESALAGKAVLFVNVASACGYTRQYEGLQALYEARKDDGLVIVGVPCNQFGAQEPGSPEEIATFCKSNFGVTFPLLEKQDVNGSARSALYTSLVGSGDDIRWNFEKFVVGSDGKVVARFPSSVRPGAEELKAAIDKALAKKG